MLPKDDHKTHSTAQQALRSLFFGTSIAGGATLMALSLSSPKFWWLGWVTLIPLFLAIRCLNVRWASVCGAFWGVSFYTASHFVSGAQVPHDWQSLLLLAAIPGVYAGLAAEVTRRKGFHPFLLALGWAGVELALKPLALRYGLLATTQGNGWFVHAVGNVGGYILVAFLLAMANAFLVSLLSSVRVPMPRLRPVSCPVSLDLLLPVLEQAVVSTRFLSPARPRAPPVLVAR